MSKILVTGAAGFIAYHLCQRLLGRKAAKNLLPMQAGDVPATCADVDDLRNAVGFTPATPLEEGLRRFVEWYRGYFGVSRP